MRTEGKKAETIVKPEILNAIRLRQDYGGQESETNSNNQSTKILNEILHSALLRSA
jgi:hypothetical protein